MDMNVGKTMSETTHLGMVNIAPIEMVMTGGWRRWHCFTHIMIIYDQR